MRASKKISAFLYYSFLIVSGGYMATALYTLVNCVFRGPFFELLESNRFAINYPFSTKHFLLGSEYTIKYVAEMVLGLGLYGIFFFVLSGVFNAFRQEKLFTLFGIRNLKRFYVFNLFIYPLLVLVWSGITVEDFPFFAMVTAHLIMGIFVFFMHAIFEQGVKLQNEQDLFI
ncbi:MAG: hypothetical protein WBP58_09505 [Chitinophagaceae bacterium]